MKTLSTAAALALVVPVLWTPFAAVAAPPTCQGQPATIVGKPGKVVLGTDGPDVVVSRGASIVSTRGGNDVVCVTGTTADGRRAKVFSGDGNDSVVADAGNVVKATLGLGEDIFRGGAEVDDVKAGDPPEDEFDSYEDDAADTIRTGGGSDRVLASSEDTLALGSGDDSLQWHGSAGEPYAGTADGGSGSNRLELAATSVVEGEEPAPWVLDNRVGTLSRTGATQVAWSRFTRFGVQVDDGIEGLLMKGGAQDESFSHSQLGLSGPPVVVEAGGGRDTIFVGGGSTPGELDLDLDGGPGRDLVHVYGYEFVKASMVLDLTAGRYRYEDHDASATAPLAGIEDVEVQGIPDVTVRGDSAANRLTVHADQRDFPVFTSCAVTMSGRGGADRLLMLSAPVDRSWKKCPAPVLRGQAGNDVLAGSLLDEKLLGGQGRDVARGGPGRDVCVAETRVGCERR